jgi:cytochrome c oxidase subunit IV
MMDAHDHSEHAPTHHVTGLPVYFGVFAALMVLTFLTVWVSTINLGLMSTPIALAIAVLKATLVILFFMHVIHSTRLTWVVIISSFLWLGVLFVLTLTDYLTRAWSTY